MVSAEAGRNSARDEIRVAIHQPVYLPWLGFFHKLSISNIFVLLDDCQAIKQSRMNRVGIKTPAGEQWLTVPVLFKGRFGQLVKDIKVDNRTDWRKKHLKTLVQNYGKAPHFDELDEFLHEYFSGNEEYLIDLDMKAIRWLLDLLDISIEIVTATDLHCTEFRGTERLIEIIRRCGGTQYVCGMGSADYLQPEKFVETGIPLVFQDYRCAEYPQIGSNDFIPGLSVVDTLANVGLEGIRNLLESNNRKIAN